MNDMSRSVKPKYILFGILGFLLLAGLWYAFRPEKLFINKRVDEAAPAQTAGQMKPLFTGRFSGEVHKTSGRATVYSSTIEPKPAATGTTFSGGRPYVVALVELEEGVRMMTNIVGCDPEEVHIGQAVSVTWEPLSDGRRLPLFTPDRTGQSG